MAETEPSPAMARIDAAMARIEAATELHAHAADTLQKRHGALKARMVEAVAALDDMLARGG